MNIIDAKDIVFEYYNLDDDGQVKEMINALNGILTPKEETLVVCGIDALDKVAIRRFKTLIATFLFIIT